MRAGASGSVEALRHRLQLLRGIVDHAPGRLPAELTERAVDVVERADTRLGHGGDHTVVAIAGATGSGKSSLFNALVGEDVAEVGVRRPTTSVTRAAAFGDGAPDLLDWLRVPRRHAVPPAGLDGLVLLDLPDHDSVEAEHRDEVDRLAEVVDTFLWVVDPQKYADAALHHDYLTRFAAHAEVTVVALNQVDLVPEGPDRRALADDLGRLLAADGLTGVRVVPTSTQTGEGLDALRRELAARVSARQAFVDRLSADIDWLAEDLTTAVGDVEPSGLDRTTERRLVDALSFAVGVDALADAVGAAHRHRSVGHVGWPPLRWVRRLRPDPLRRLGLDRNPEIASAPGGGSVVPRTSRGRPSSVADAAVDDALRTTAVEASTGLPDLWVERVHAAACSRRGDIDDALDVAVGSARLPTREPRWWTVASAVQWLLAGAMAAGLLWLVIIGVVAWLGLPDLPTPELGQLPYPTALLLGGAACGLLVAAAGRWVAAVGARRRARAAREELHRRVADAGQRLVVDPVEEELRRLGALRDGVHGLHQR